MRGGLAFGFDPFVLLEHVCALDLLADDELGVAGGDDHHAAQHLPHDHLDVLVVDLHALQAVHILHLVDDVTGKRFDALQAQDVVRIGRPVDDRLALVHDLAIVHQDMLFLRDEELVRDAIHVGDHQALLAFGVLAERHGTGDLGKHAGILRRARLEQLGHPRQAAGDVARLRGFLGDTGQHVADRDILAVTHRDDRPDLERVDDRLLGTGDLHLAPRLVDQLDLRAHALDLGAGTTLRIDHDQGRQAGDLVDLPRHGHAFLDVLELDAAGVLRDHRTGMRIPVGQHLPGLRGVAILCRERCTVRHLVALALAAALVDHQHLAGTRDRDRLATCVGHVAHRAREADGTRRLGLDQAGHRRTRSRAADVEGTHRQLGTRLADRLRGDDAHCLADVGDLATAEVASVALGAQAPARLAGERGTYLDLIDTDRLDQFDRIFVEQHAAVEQHFLGLGMHDVCRQHAAEHALAQRLDDLAPFDQRTHREALGGTAVLLGDHQILGHVDQAAGQVTRVGGLQRGVGQAFARAVGRDEVLQDVQALAEVRGDRRLDDRAVRLGHQAAHAGQLADLRGGTARTRIGHHVDRVERLLHNRLALFHLGHLHAAFVDQHRLAAELLHHGLGHEVAGAAPDVDDLVVALALGDQARGVLRLDLLDFLLGGSDELLFLVRHEHVADRDRHAGAGGQRETRLHQLVGEDDGLAQAAAPEGTVDQPRDLFLLQGLVDHRERQARRQDLGQHRAPDGGVVALDRLDTLAVVVEQHFTDADLDLGLQLALAGLVGTASFGHVDEGHALAARADLLAGRVVQAQHDVLRRHDDRLAVGRRQHVVRRQHQRARFHLRLERQRHVHGHLVAVEVGVERGADQRMQLDRLAFDQHRLEGLDAEAVQGRGAVEHHRVFADDVFEDVPDRRLFALDHALGGLDRGRHAEHFELVEDERLEQLERHLLRQAALVQLELRAHHDDRTPGVVDALAQQVLPEAAALALDHVGKRLQRTLVGAGHRLAAAAVVEQRVDGFLEHALFVAHDDLGRLQLEQALEAVVAVDHPAVQVVQVGGGEAAAVQRHQRTQVRRQHRQHFHDHPVGLDARLLERLEHLQALGDLLDLGLGAGRREVGAQRLYLAIEVEVAQQRAHALGTHAGRELVAMLFELGKVVILGQQLAALERGHAGFGDHVCLEVQRAFDVAQRHVEHHAQARRQRLEEPDVGDRRGELDVAHALAADLRQRDLDAALLADDAAVLQALVLAAEALVILDRPEDLRAEQAVALGLEGPVVDGLGLLHLAIRPRTDLVGRGQPDLDRVEFFFLGDLLEQVEQSFHSSLLVETDGCCSRGVVTRNCAGTAGLPQ